MVDEARLLALLERLAEAEGELQRLRTFAPADVRGDVDRMYALKYLFVMASEAAIDIGQHMIASEGLRAPATFAARVSEPPGP